MLARLIGSDALTMPTFLSHLWQLLSALCKVCTGAKLKSMMQNPQFETISRRRFQVPDT